MVDAVGHILPILVARLTFRGMRGQTRCCKGPRCCRDTG